MKRWFTLRNAYRVAVIAAAVALVALFAVDVFGRVGGGHSYSGGSRGGSSGSRGGSGGGSGDGGAIVWLVFEALRLLVYLTINYPLIGIPLDIILIVGVGYFLRRRSRSVTAGFSSMANAMQSVGSSYSPDVVARSFEQLKKFDPNFSEIVFTDFCYALYGKAHDARGGGKAKPDLFSPYLSEEARASLLQRNSPSLQAVKGIIVGSMKVEQIQVLKLLWLVSAFSLRATTRSLRPVGNDLLRRRALAA